MPAPACVAGDPGPGPALDGGGATSRPIAALTRLAGATTLTAALLLCPTADSQAQQQAPSPRRAPQVDVVTEGVYASAHPVARVRIDRPGYVALFEVEPGVGATMLSPDDPPDREAARADGRRPGRRRKRAGAIPRLLLVLLFHRATREAARRRPPQRRIQPSR